MVLRNFEYRIPNIEKYLNTKISQNKAKKSIYSGSPQVKAILTPERKE